MFLNGLGLYKKEKGQSYDRAIFNNLYGGDFFFRRDLVNKRITIKDPRLNMCLLGHPNKFFEFAMLERSTKDDGLSHRFLMCAPKPQFLPKETVIAAKRNAHFSMIVVFYVIQKLVGDGLVFNLDTEAEDCFDKIYKDSTSFREKFINNENYLWYFFLF